MESSCSSLNLLVGHVVRMKVVLCDNSFRLDFSRGSYWATAEDINSEVRWKDKVLPGYAPFRK